MKFNKLAILGLVLTGGCLVENANHCAISVNICTAAQTCNVDTGRCESGSTPGTFTISTVSPAVIPRQFDYNNGTVTITTTGLPKSKIVAVNIDQVAAIPLTMQTDTPSGSQYVFPLATLAALSKCGPLDVSLVDEAGNKYPASAELFGRYYQKWQYQAKKSGLRSSVKSFAMNPLSAEAFDYVFSDSSGAYHVLPNVTNKIYSSLVTDDRNYSTIKYTASDSGKYATSPMVDSGVLKLYTKSLSSATPATYYDSCGQVAGYSYADFSVLGDQKNRFAHVVCEKLINGTATRYTFLRQVSLLSTDGQTGSSFSRPAAGYGFYGISYPSSDGFLGALVMQKYPLLTGYSIMTIDRPNNDLGYSDSIAITGVLPAVSSIVPAKEDPTKKVIHFVASTIQDTGNISIQVIAGFSNFMSMGLRQELIFSKELDPSTFAEQKSRPDAQSLPVGIEVKDINCDGKYDIILKASKTVVAYLGIGDLEWNWDAPKILFKSDGNAADFRIKKQELWVPAFESVNELSVMGILDSQGNLQMYQQE